MYKLIIAGIGVLAAALLTLGCGGGGGGEATAQVSEGEFYKQARAICAKTQKKLQAQFQDVGKSIEAVYNQAGPVLKQEADELSALAGPEQVEEKVKPMITNLAKAVRMVSQQGENALNDPIVEKYKREAAALKLNEC